VKGPDGKPVEGARVAVMPLFLRLGDVPSHTRTDATGAFRIQLKAPGLVNLSVEAKGLAARHLQRIQPTAALAITLARGAVLEGMVKDGTSGQPVPGARVEARPGGTFPNPWDPGAGLIAATADAKGAFRLEGLSPKAYGVTATARGYGRAQNPSAVAGRRVELFLFPGSSVRGVVRGPAGEPIPGAVVRVEGGMRPMVAGPPSVTDPAGRYEMLGVPPGVYRVMAHHKDWALGLASGVAVDRQADVELDFRLDRGVKVTGRLIDTAGRPLQGRIAPQEIAGETSLWALGEILRTEAGADGRFSLDHVPAGEHALAAEARGYGVKRVEVSAGARPVDLGDIVLEPGSTIRGRVRDKAGLPIGQAQLWAFAMGRGGMRVEATSEPDGTFVLAGLPGGALRVTARASGYGTANLTASAATETLDVVLEAAGTVTGLVVDEAGRPVESFQADASPTRREQGGMVMRAGGLMDNSGGDGRFTLYDLAAGEYVVEVSAPERGRAVVSAVKVTAGGSTDVGRLTLTAGGIVRGQVVDAAGSPIPGATVAVSAGERFWGPDRSTGMTDGTGAFEVRGVNPGIVTASATHPSFAAGEVTGLEVDPARPAEARIVLTQGGRIEGVARRRGNLPVAGATVQALSERANRRPLQEPTHAVTAADGSFWMDHVPPGRMRVTLMAREGASTWTSSQSREVEVQEGQTASVEFLSREIAVSGRVTRGGGPVPGVRLSLRSSRSMTMMFGSPGMAALPPGPQRMTAVTREDGAYEMLVDEPGQFRAHFESSDGRNLPQRMVEVPDADAFSLDFEFSGIPLAGVVVDRDREQPVANATIFASPTQGGAPGGATDTTGPDGRFQLDVDAGEYRVNARAEGYGRATQEVTVGPSGLADVRLVVARGASLRGRVLDIRGRPAANVDVYVSPVDDERGSGGFANSLPDGSFTVDGLDVRAYSVFAGSSTGTGFGVFGPVNPGDRDVVVRLRLPGRVRVTVLGPEGGPMKDANPRVASVNGLRYSGPMGGGVTDASGTVEFDAMAGTLDIVATRPKLAGRATVGVSEGGTAAVEITLKPVTPKSP
jgi:protocatechuate 3,4-dioxygenase beta subunit